MNEIRRSMMWVALSEGLDRAPNKSAGLTTAYPAPSYPSSILVSKPSSRNIIMAAIKPFEIAIPDADLTQLKQRLELTRFPEGEIEEAGWDYGAPL